MSEIKFRPVPPEPAHPMVVKLHDDLVVLYTAIREKCQVKIDQAFDEVSRQIGFVVTTTVPVVLEVGEKGAVERFSMGAEHLQGTLFDRALTVAVEELMTPQIPLPPPRTYRLYLFWFEALKLKLRTDWMEPAHFSVGLTPEEIRWAKEWLKHKEMVKKVEELEKDIFVIPRPWEEPAHWFDPGTLIAAEERVLISVIDEVYPELRLVDRISHYRHGMGRVAEMSKFARAMADPTPEPAEPPQEMLAELKELLRRYGY